MDLEKAASAHDADILIIYTMIDALLTTHANPSAAIATFREKAEALVKNTPQNVPEEQVVDLRARIAQNLTVWERTIASSARR